MSYFQNSARAIRTASRCRIDGDSEIHKVRDSWLNAPVIKQIPNTNSNGGPTLDEVGRKDFDWLGRRTNVAK